MSVTSFLDSDQFFLYLDTATVIVGARFVDKDMKVEIEADAIVLTNPRERGRVDDLFTMHL